MGRKRSKRFAEPAEKRPCIRRNDDDGDKDDPGRGRGNEKNRVLDDEPEYFVAWKCCYCGLLFDRKKFRPHKHMDANGKVSVWCSNCRNARE